MGPRTGPLPASSTPNAHGGPGSGLSSESGFRGGRRVGGTGEKCVYEAPVRSRSWLIEGAMKTSDAGVSRETSSSICESAILAKLFLLGRGIAITPIEVS